MRDKTKINRRVKTKCPGKDLRRIKILQNERLRDICRLELLR